jgi:hypothetical protein
MKVFYFGFNLRQVGDAVVFGSAPGTGASLLAEKGNTPITGSTFYAELEVDGAAEGSALNVEFTGTLAKATASTPIVSGMHTYEIGVPAGLGEITSLRIVPDTVECVLSVKGIGFKG